MYNAPTRRFLGWLLLVAVSATFSLGGEVGSEGEVKYLGIPYAHIPRRWAPSVPCCDQKHSGAGGNNAYEPACMQAQTKVLWFPEMINVSVSEDCLYLNVFRPNTSDVLPVVVWIHGGGWAVGAAQQPSNDPVAFVLRHNVVFISFNYRLGVFGSLALAELAEETSDNVTGVYGFQDQQLALKWIASHLNQFGGDPRRITLMGESAGGTSVCAHLALATIRFHRAIVSSSVCERIGSQLIPVQEALGRGRAFATAVGCGNLTGADLLVCLRNLSATTILSRMAMRPDLLPEDLSIWYPTSWPSFWKISDWGDAWAAGHFEHNVSILILTTRDEAAFILRKTGTEPDRIRTQLDGECVLAHFLGVNASFCGSSFEKRALPFSAPPNHRVAASNTQEALAARIAYYLHSYRTDSMYQVVTDIASDAWLNCIAIASADELSRYTRVFSGWFVHRPLQQDTGAFIGYESCHGTDLPFIFGNPVWLWDFNSPFSLEQETLQELLSDSLGNFIHSGDPSTEAVRWPEWTAASRVWVRWDIVPTVGLYDRDRFCRCITAQDCDVSDDDEGSWWTSTAGVVTITFLAVFGVVLVLAGGLGVLLWVRRRHPRGYSNVNVPL